MAQTRVQRMAFEELAETRDSKNPGTCNASARFIEEAYPLDGLREMPQEKTDPSTAAPRESQTVIRDHAAEKALADPDIKAFLNTYSKARQERPVNQFDLQQRSFQIPPPEVLDR